ncbi:30S ribosomal protein S7 [Mesomycoplasma hyopneumoniae 7422]|nr:30S ribosomal protein S7 [Mesomycoplasma hyopneumoniae 7422]
MLKLHRHFDDLNKGIILIIYDFQVLIKLKVLQDLRQKAGGKEFFLVILQLYFQLLKNIHLWHFQRQPLLDLVGFFQDFQELKKIWKAHLNRKHQGLAKKNYYNFLEPGGYFLFLFDTG